MAALVRRKRKSIGANGVEAAGRMMGIRGRMVQTTGARVMRVISAQSLVVQANPILLSSPESARGKAAPPAPVPAMAERQISSNATQPPRTEWALTCEDDSSRAAALHHVPLLQPDQCRNVEHCTRYAADDALQKDELADVGRERGAEHGEHVDGQRDPQRTTQEVREPTGEVHEWEREDVV